MLSLKTDSLYVFEPLRKVQNGSSNLEHWTAIEKQQIAPIMEGIYGCNVVRDYIEKLPNVDYFKIHFFLILGCSQPHHSG